MTTAVWNTCRLDASLYVTEFQAICCSMRHLAAMSTWCMSDIVILYYSYHFHSFLKVFELSSGSFEALKLLENDRSF